MSVSLLRPLCFVLFYGIKRDRNPNLVQILPSEERLVFLFAEVDGESLGFRSLLPLNAGAVTRQGIVPNLMVVGVLTRQNATPARAAQRRDAPTHHAPQLHVLVVHQYKNDVALFHALRTPDAAGEQRRQQREGRGASSPQVSRRPAASTSPHAFRIWIRHGSLRGAAPGLQLSHTLTPAPPFSSRPVWIPAPGERTSSMRRLESDSQALNFEEVESRVSCHMTETEWEETENTMHAICRPTSHLRLR
ncbi:hypothetical protein XENOCAPTIV_000930 [Xenoophorus captivus]|uniref:Uncharacterized protein n=1 Tax=Xenoophorus captivus TaxID=1517983 RepID=A0ABV0QP58_9TELE